MSSAKKINAFSLFIIFVFMGSLFYAGFFLVHTASSRNLSLTQKTNELNEAIQTLTTNETLYSESYYKSISDLISSDPSISAFILTHNNVPAFVWPVGSSFIVSDENDNPYIASNSPLIQIKNGYSVTNKGVTNWSAAYSSVTAGEIFYRFSHAFIAILTATIICLLVIAYISVFKAPVQAKSKSFSAPANDFKEDSTTNTEEDDYEADYPYSVSFNDDIDDVFDEQDNEVVVRKMPVQGEIPDEFVVEAAKRQAAVHASPKKSVLKESEDPLGLFSDLTGFGWESYLETRLDSELIRAASSEYDLALFIVKIEGVERTHSSYGEICSSLLSFFKFRDMVFEYGSDSFAGIVTGMDINGCMASVENLYSSLTEILNKNNISGKISIGISTRSFRLIPGDRMLHEAKEAITKAGEVKDMPIVAFRVNPTKYKEFLEEEMTQEPIAS